ncbi:DUF1304 domain-containing protein [Streptomyces sp. NPDC086783]|uniref:DUF1304 domain-containing protein n=1 Tax=Streptomyces sp. NPDC086783 TaxID=3365758 RepID=UPI00380A3B1C
MKILAALLVGSVSIMHFYIAILEMALWQKPRGRAIFRMDEATARLTAPLASNQGLYNIFLAAGLIWGLASPNPFSFRLEVFFLTCVALAGAYGFATTSSRKILLGQFTPAFLALTVVLYAS